VALQIEPDSTAFRAYGATEITERHRHRYEFNCEYEKRLTDAGLRITGAPPTASTLRSLKPPAIRGFLGCQFIRSSSPSPWRRIHYSQRSWAQRTHAGSAAKMPPPQQGTETPPPQPAPPQQANPAPFSYIAIAYLYLAFSVPLCALW